MTGWPVVPIRLPGRRVVAATATLGVLLACAPHAKRAAPPTPAPAGADAAPSVLIGAFTDDYGGRHRISDTLWQEGERQRYRIVAWNVAERWFVARNAETNPRDGGQWSRVDWVQLDGMPPYTWGYCHVVWNASTRAEAESAPPAGRATPRTGCNRSPFTRMAPLGASPPAGER